MPFIMAMEWSNVLVIQLIKEYRNKRELWDSTCDTYRLSSVKFEAWRDLASMFECEIIDVKRKMNSLLASHRRERAKIAQGCMSNWFAMPYMKFLKGRNNKDEEVQDDDDVVEIPEDSLAQQSESEMSDQNLTTVQIENIDKRKKPRDRLIRNKPNKRRLMLPSSSAKLDEGRQLLEALKSLQKTEKKRDECDIFGEYIANSLRKHDQRTRAMIKHAMNNILFESEMKKYNVTNYQHVEINLSEETNPLIIPDQNGETIPIEVEEGMIGEAHEDLSSQKLETIDNSYTN